MRWLLRLWVAIGLASLPYVAAAQQVGPNQNSFVMGSPTGGNQGYGTINAEGLFINGVSVGSGGGGCTNNCTFTGTTTTAVLTSSQGITDTTPATALAYSFNGTAGLKFGGTICAPNINGCVLDNEISYVENTSGAVRMGYTFRIITSGGSTTGIDEQDFHGINLASGIFDHEITGHHTFAQSAAGTTVAQYENIETSTLFSGTHAAVDSALLLQNYTRTGTNTAGAFGVNLGLTNQNPTAGSLFEWTAINILAPALGATSVATTGISGDGTTATVTFSGTDVVAIGGLVTVAGVTPNGYNAVNAVVTASSAGSVSYANATTGTQTVAGTLTFSGSPPEHNFGVRISDPNGDISTAGRVFIGSPVAANTVAGRMLTVQGPDQTNGTFPLLLTDSTGATVFSVRSTGNVSFSGNLTVPGLGTGTQVSCLGLTSANLVVPVTGACRTSGGSGTVTSITAGTGLTGGTITTSGTIALNAAADAAWTVDQTITGTNTSNSFNALLVQNSSSVLELSVTNGGTVTAGNTLVIGQSGTQTGKLSLTNATATSSTVNIIPPIGVVLTAANITLQDVNSSTLVYGLSTAGISVAGTNIVGSGLVGSVSSAFKITLGVTGSGGTSVTATFATAAAHGYACGMPVDETSSLYAKSVATSTTVATWSFFSQTTGIATAPSNGDVVTAQCLPF